MSDRKSYHESLEGEEGPVTGRGNGNGNGHDHGEVNESGVVTPRLPEIPPEIMRIQDPLVLMRHNYALSSQAAMHANLAQDRAERTFDAYRETVWELREADRKLTESLQKLNTETNQRLTESIQKLNQDTEKRISTALTAATGASREQNRVMVELTDSFDNLKKEVKNAKSSADLTLAIGHCLEVSMGVQKEVLTLKGLVGVPPERIDLRRASQQGELTPEELAIKEEGTGLFALVYGLFAHNTRERQEELAEAAKQAAEAAAKKTQEDNQGKAKEAAEEAATLTAKGAKKRITIASGGLVGLYTVASGTEELWKPMLNHFFKQLLGY